MIWIDESSIAVGVLVDHWEQAVEAAGELLVQGGFAERRYIDGMLRTVRELGPYIVLAPGFAMPHARPDDGVIKAGFSVVTLQKPVNFGNADNDPVRVVMAFCAPNEHAHIDSLTTLAQKLDQPGFLDSVAAATTVAECFHILNNGG